MIPFQTVFLPWVQLTHPRKCFSGSVDHLSNPVSKGIPEISPMWLSHKMPKLRGPFHLTKSPSRRMDALNQCRLLLPVSIYIVREGFLVIIRVAYSRICFLESGIQFSTDVASQIYSGIPGSQFISSNSWSLPCNSKFSITLTFGGKRFTISERDTIVKSSDGTCTGVVTGGAQGLVQIGAPFMRNVYTCVIPYLPLSHRVEMLFNFFRQFGAEKASNGSVKFFVGFAEKNERQKVGGGAPQTTQNIGLLLVLAVASIVAILF
jgi:hypothetical protein